MNLNIREWEIGTKLIAGFLSVTVILAVGGWLGYRSMDAMSAKTEDIVTAGPWLEAAMEMKYAVARQMQMIMEMLEAGNQEDLDAVWVEYENFANGFDTAFPVVEVGRDDRLPCVGADHELPRVVVVNQHRRPLVLR